MQASDYTWNGRHAVMSNADQFVHLAVLGSEPGVGLSECGYSRSQLREPTMRELRERVLCRTCIDRAYASEIRALDEAEEILR